MKLICEIKQSELLEEANDEVDCTSLRDYKSVGAYTWSLESSESRPLLIIPGEPNRLVDQVESKLRSKQLTKSSNELTFNENRWEAAFLMAPLFRCVSVCTPHFEFDKMDIITDRTNLRNLFNFVENQLDKEFRIELQCVGNSLVLIRNDASMNRSFDYGKDFETQATTSELNQGSYSRVATYKFGSHNVLVRFEVDCCLPKSNVAAAKRTLDYSASTKFAGMSRLGYVPYGELDEEKLVELTTKSTFNSQFPMGKWNQLFFSNTDLLVLGWHNRGRLQRIEKLALKQVAERCQRSSASTKSSLGKLNTLLTRLKSIASQSNNKEEGAEMPSAVYSVIFSQATNSLSIYECVDHSGCLPKDFYAEVAKLHATKRSIAENESSCAAEEQSPTKRIKVRSQNID